MAIYRIATNVPNETLHLLTGHFVVWDVNITNLQVSAGMLTIQTDKFLSEENKAHLELTEVINFEFS